MSLRIKSDGNERQKRECRGSQRGSWRRRLKSLITIVLASLLVSLLTTSLATPVSAQEDYTVTIGQDKVFTDCNYHYAKFDNLITFEHLPWPDPADREAYSTGNTVYVSMWATPGHAARADSWIGVDFEWVLGPYTWEEVEDMPVNVTLDFYYQICGSGSGYWGDCWSAAAVVFKGMSDDPSYWYDVIGSADNPDDVGCRSKTVSETYTTTVGELEGRQWIVASCTAYSTNEECTRHSSAEVQINSIKIEFPELQITHFTVSLEHYVGPNEEEWYGQQVMASVYHPEGSDQIESFIAVDPTGEELPTDCPTGPECSITPDSWNFMWWEGYLPNPPAFGEYTITATDKDGCVAEVTSWPTDYISDRVPNITDPINHYVTTRVPTFKWEPFSDRTTGYLIEVTGPPEETLPDDDCIWRIGLPASQTEVQFNSDGTAAVSQLNPENTYHLTVFAFEDACSGIQCYRNTSIRAIEFNILEEGDVLLCRSPKSLVPGFWTHCGIYIGDNQVVEALGFKGVVNNSLSDWSFPNKKCVRALRVKTDVNTRKKAANFAKSRVGRPFDLLSILLLQKQRGGGALLSEYWYCSELVWAAYLNASNDQIDLDSNKCTICGGAVTSTEIDLSEYTKTLGEYCPIIPETVYTMILRIWVQSPVDLNIIDPDGLILNKQGSAIPEAIYEEVDIDEDGELDDLIAIPKPKMGNYMIHVVPEPDAELTDTYTLTVSAGDTTIVLAENVPISDIPSQPYIIKLTDSGIFSVPALPGISVNKVADPPDVAPSSNVEFTITVSNTGDCTLDPVRVVDTLLGWMSYVSSSPAADTHDGTIIWNNVGPLDPGDSKTITLVARIASDASGSVTNAVMVTGTNLTTGVNVTDSDTVTVTILAKTIEPSTKTLIDVTTEIKSDGIVIEGEQFGWETGNGNLLNNPPISPGEAVGGIKYDEKMIGSNGTTEFTKNFGVNTNVTPNLAVTKDIGYKSGDLGSLSYDEQVGMRYSGASPPLSSTTKCKDVNAYHVCSVKKPIAPSTSLVRH